MLMRKLKKPVFILSLACAAAAGSTWFSSFSFPAPGKTPSVTCAFAGITWTEGFDATKARAKKSGKPFLFLQLVGRLDDEFC